MGLDGLDFIGSALQREDYVLQQCMSAQDPFLVMACVRELDLLFVRSHFCREQLTEQERLALHGGFEAIRRFRQNANFSQGTPIFDMPAGYSKVARTCLTHATNYLFLKEILHLSQRELARIEVQGDRRVVVWLEKRVGVDLREERLVRAYWNENRQVIDEALSKRLDAVTQERVARTLERVVRPWMEHFIGYDSTPFLDKIFARMATPHLVVDPLASFFPDETKLGNLRFEDLKAVALMLISFEIKHVHCALKLAEIRQSSRLINLLAVASDRENLVLDIQVSCGFDRAKASEILSLFTWEQGDVNLTFELDGFPPPLIATSAWQVVKPAFGILREPFAFMLRRARQAYTRDWDVAVNHLEAQFRSELYNLFQGTRFVCIPSSVKLRRRGKVITDVDAAVFDVVSGTLGLYQLKWQFPYWGSARERDSRSKNFLSGGNTWADAVQAVLQEMSLDDLHATFRIPRRSGVVRQVIGFVLGRFFSEFPQTDPEGIDGVTWGSWPQFVEARAAAYQKEDVQDAMAESLRRSHTEPFPSGVTRDLQIGELLISLRRE